MTDPSDPTAGKIPGHRPSPAASCPNCGGGRSGRYCAACGQNDRNYVRGLLSVTWDFCRDSFEVDSRLFQTLKLLFFKPGTLSREFCRNRRARYMSPVRLYLFSSFLFFLVVSVKIPDSLVLGGDDLEVVVDGRSEESEDSVSGGAEPLVLGAGVYAGGRPTAAQLRVWRTSLGSGQSQKLDDLLNRPDTDFSRTGLALLAMLVGPGDAASPDLADPADSDLRLIPADSGGPEDPDRALDGFPGRPDPNAVSRGPGTIEDAEPLHLVARLVASTTIDFLHDPVVFLERVVGNMTIPMFFLLPFLALALAFCYIGKKRYFVEHLVFGMHVQAFSFLVFSAALLTPGGTIGVFIQIVLSLAPLFYYLIALRRFYRDGWIRTLVKGSFVWGLYAFVLFLGFLGVLLLMA
jgi:hypothetical protein